MDSESLPIILGELDTVADFGAYLDEKTRAIMSMEVLGYSGEEDLLAHYFCNFDERSKRHFISTNKLGVNAAVIEEGEWARFVESELYTETARANEESYLWDDLLQLTGQDSSDRVLLGADPKTGPSAVVEMAKEPRFVRRALSLGIVDAIKRFPGPPKPGTITRHVFLMPSYYAGTAYLFLQMAASVTLRERSDYREKGHGKQHRRPKHLNDPCTLTPTGRVVGDASNATAGQDIMIVSDFLGSAGRKSPRIERRLGVRRAWRRGADRLEIYGPPRLRGLSSLMLLTR